MPGYSLWLVPGNDSAGSRALSRALAANIAAIARAFERAPAFPPHVTLLGPDGDLSAAAGLGLDELVVRGERLAARVRALARGPLVVPVRPRAESGATRFRCVFLRVDGAAAPPALAGARREALELFRAAEEPAGFFPHLSLLYADEAAAPPDARRRLCAPAAEAGADGMEDARREVAAALEAAGAGGAGMPLRALELWSTGTDDPANWRRVAGWEL